MAIRQRSRNRLVMTLLLSLLLAMTALGIGRGADVAASGGAVARAPIARRADCTPGTTKKIAFMLKQQTAFRYLHADVPFFKKAAEAAGYEVIVQSADNDAQTQVSQAENVITQGVDAIVIQPVDFNVAASIAKMASDAGIPLASYDASPLRPIGRGARLSDHDMTSLMVGRRG